MRDKHFTNILALTTLVSSFASSGALTNSSANIYPLKHSESEGKGHIFDGHLASFKKEVLSDDTQSKLKALREFSQVCTTLSIVRVIHILLLQKSLNMPDFPDFI